MIPVASLAQAVGFFTGTLPINPASSHLDELFAIYSQSDDDFSDVRGKENGETRDHHRRSRFAQHADVVAELTSLPEPA